MKLIELSEIPVAIKNFVQTIDSIKYPRQGYTSDVVILKNGAQQYVLKRTIGQYHCSLLKEEVKNLSDVSN